MVLFRGEIRSRLPFRIESVCSVPDGHVDKSREAEEALLGAVPHRGGEGPGEERKGEMGSHESCWLFDPTAMLGSWKYHAHFIVE